MYTYQQISILSKAPRVLFHGDLYGAETRNCDAHYLSDLVKSITSHNAISFSEATDWVLPDSEHDIAKSCTLIDVLMSSFKLEDTKQGKLLHLYIDDELARQAWEDLRDRVDDLHR